MFPRRRQVLQGLNPDPPIPEALCSDMELKDPGTLMRCEVSGETFDRHVVADSVVRN